MTNEANAQPRLIEAMLDGITLEEAQEVFEGLYLIFEQRVSEAQYHPHDDVRAKRLSSAEAILRRMERAEAGLSWKEQP